MVGQVKRPHGIKGEVFVQLLTDHPGRVFAPGVVLRPAGASGTEPDPDLPPLRVEAARPFKQGLLVTFGGMRDRNDADPLRGRDLLLPLEEVEEPDEDEFFYHELLGLEVETSEGEALGRVREVYELRPADLLEVRGPRGTVLIPFAANTLVEVDLEGGRIVVELPEGLLEL